MIDVHIGFMDEEVRPVLSLMMQGALEAQGRNHAIFESSLSRVFSMNIDRPIIVIERDDITRKTTLFEQTQAVYTLPWDYQIVVPFGANKKFGELAVISRPDAKGPGAEYIRIVAGLVNYFANQNKLAEKLIRQWNMTMKSKLDMEGMSYTVLGFNMGYRDEIHDPVIVVRSPEMGLQPDMLRTHLITVMMAIGKIPEVKKSPGINVFCYGAGGAQVPDTKPGAFRRTMGSFYIGAEVSESDIVMPRIIPPTRTALSTAITRRWNGIIAYATADTFEEIFVQTEDTQDKALAAAQAEFRKTTGATHSRIVAICQEFQRAWGSRTGKQSYSMSLTASFFIPGEVKAAANAKGINGDVAMEDYHILRVINIMKNSRDFARIVDYSVSRIDCDPPAIPESVFEHFQHWAIETRWSREHYVNAILWGLNGLRLSALNWATAHWQFADRLGVRTEKEKYCYVLTDGMNERVLCPFYTEVACDLINTLADNQNPKKGTAGCFPGLTVSPRLKLQLESLAQQIQAEASRSLQTNPSKVRSLISTFVDNLVMLFTENRLVDEIQRDQRGQAIDTARLPIWARPGWAAGVAGDVPVVFIRQNRAERLGRIRRMWGETYFDTKKDADVANGNVDRALYKSTNMLSLQVTAASLREGQRSDMSIHASGWSAVMQELRQKASGMSQQQLKKRQLTVALSDALRNALWFAREQMHARQKAAIKKALASRTGSDCGPSSDGSGGGSSGSGSPPIAVN